MKLRTYEIKHSPYDFFGKKKFMIEEVLASSCLAAIIGFRYKVKENSLKEVLGVKPKYSYVWRRDPQLLDLAQVTKAGVKLGILIDNGKE